MLWLHDADVTWKPRLHVTFLLFLGASIFTVIACLLASLFCSCSSCASSRPICEVIIFPEANAFLSYLFINDRKG
jgi:hypothetical protein